MKIESNEIYTTKEVAELLKISLPTVKRMLKDGRLPSVRIGKQHRFLGKDLIEILFVKRCLPNGEGDKSCRAVSTGVVEKTGEKARESDRTRHRLVGKIVPKAIFGQDGQVLIEPGSVITDEVIDSALKNGLFLKLIESVELPEET
jgi:excisionase family DNA binding protein